MHCLCGLNPMTRSGSGAKDFRSDSQTKQSYHLCMAAARQTGRQCSKYAVSLRGLGSRAEIGPSFDSLRLATQEALRKGAVDLVEIDLAQLLQDPLRYTVLAWRSRHPSYTGFLELLETRNWRAISGLKSLRNCSRLPSVQEHGIGLHKAGAGFASPFGLGPRAHELGPSGAVRGGGPCVISSESP